MGFKGEWELGEITVYETQVKQQENNENLWRVKKVNNTIVSPLTFLSMRSYLWKHQPRCCSKLKHHLGKVRQCGCAASSSVTATAIVLPAVLLNSDTTSADNRPFVLWAIQLVRCNLTDSCVTLQRLASSPTFTLINHCFCVLGHNLCDILPTACISGEITSLHNHVCRQEPLWGCGKEREK